MNRRTFLKVIIAAGVGEAAFPLKSRALIARNPLEPWGTVGRGDIYGWWWRYSGPMRPEIERLFRDDLAKKLPHFEKAIAARGQKVCGMNIIVKKPGELNDDPLSQIGSIGAKIYTKGPRLKSHTAYPFPDYTMPLLEGVPPAPRGALPT